MTTKQKVRTFRNWLRAYMDRAQYYLDLDLSMDGSGELGGTIHRHHQSDWIAVAERVLAQLELEPEDYAGQLELYMKVEGQYCYPGPGTDVPLAYYDFLELQEILLRVEN